METKLVLGLGNPDPVLEETYHNAGMLAVAFLADRAARAEGMDAAPRFKAYKGLFSYATIGGRTFVMPLVFMNDSGRAAKEALRVFKVAPEEIAVAHDDSDLAIGSFKIVRGGRAAGHKGIQSIIDHIGTDGFWRARIGIREKDEIHRKKAGDFVLSPITKADKKTLEEVFGQMADQLGF